MPNLERTPRKVIPRWSETHMGKSAAEDKHRHSRESYRDRNTKRDKKGHIMKCRLFKVTLHIWLIYFPGQSVLLQLYYLTSQSSNHWAKARISLLQKRTQRYNFKFPDLIRVSDWYMLNKTTRARSRININVYILVFVKKKRWINTETGSHTITFAGAGPSNRGNTKFLNYCAWETMLRRHYWSTELCEVQAEAWRIMENKFTNKFTVFHPRGRIKPFLTVLSQPSNMLFE